MYAPRAPRPGLPALVLGLALLAPPAAAAAPSEGYQEVHRVGDDVVVRVDRAGHALVEHTLRYRVVAGRLRGFEVAGLDPAAEDFTSSAFESDDGKRVPTIVEPVGQDAAARSVRVTLDDPHGVRRGSYQVVLQYRLDLATPEHLVRRGGLYRLTFRSPPASEGRDGARARVELPVAPTEPQPDGEDAATVPATVQRGAEVDTLDLVRPHVARGEAPVWSLRVDPRALPDVAAARDDLRSRPARPPAPRSRVPDLARGLGLVLLAGAVSALVARKGASLAPRQRFVVGLGRLAPARAPAAGVAHAVGTALLLWGSPSLGCAALAVVAGLTVVRAPFGRAPARGPAAGSPAKDAFAPAAGDPRPPPSGALALGALGARARPRARAPWRPNRARPSRAPSGSSGRGAPGRSGARSARWLAPRAAWAAAHAKGGADRFVRGATRRDEARSPPSGRRGAGPSRSAWASGRRDAGQRHRGPRDPRACARAWTPAPVVAPRGARSAPAGARRARRARPSPPQLGRRRSRGSSSPPRRPSRPVAVAKVSVPRDYAAPRDAGVNRRDASPRAPRDLVLRPIRRPPAEVCAAPGPWGLREIPSMSTSDDPQPRSPSHRRAGAGSARRAARARPSRSSGDVSRDVGALVESGAPVHVYDPIRRGARDVTPRGVVVRPLPVSFEVRDGAFDCAVVTDLGAVPSPDALLESLARLVADDGAVVVVARNGAAPHAEGGFDYTELFDLVALRFERVRMFAILPFAGALVAELGLEESPR